jgi:hypothetical protein
MINTKGYLETISLMDPNWAALALGINWALDILDGKKDKAKTIKATAESLNALELAFSLNDGSAAEGFYRGIQFVPDGSLVDGDFVVAGSDESVLVLCDPWDPYWVDENRQSAKKGYDDSDPGVSDQDDD